MRSIVGLCRGILSVPGGSSREGIGISVVYVVLPFLVGVPRISALFLFVKLVVEAIFGFVLDVTASCFIF